MATNDLNHEHNDPTAENRENTRSKQNVKDLLTTGFVSSLKTSAVKQQSQLASVHDVSRQTSATLLDGESKTSKPEIATDADKLKGTHYLTRWQSSDNPAYPGIPFQVARYLCESSPDLLSRMEAALHSAGTAGGSPHRFNGNRGVAPVVSSSLSYMSSMADALALQESVIGSRTVKPASLEVVSQLVQSNRDSLSNTGSHQNLLTPENSASSVVEQNANDSPVSWLPPLVDPSLLADSPSIPAPTSQTTENSTGNSLASKMDGEARQLHPFPKERISTVVERTSWFSSGAREEVSQPAHPLPPKPPRSLEMASRTSGSVRGSSSECNFVGEDESGYQHNSTHKKHSGGFTDTASYAASDLDSVCSERYELDSNFSERLELQSNMSDISGIEEEMFRIRKLLLDTPHHDSTAGGTDVSHYVQSLDMLRERAAMEGQLEALRGELETAKRERSQLQVQLSSNQTALNSQSVLSRSAAEETDYLRRHADELERRLHDSENVVEQLRAAVEIKTEELTLQRHDARETEAESQRLRIALQEMKVDADSRDGAVQGLKGKVAELHIELQNVLQLKTKSEGELSASRNQVASELKMKEWYRQQLNDAQAMRSALQQEVIGLQAEKGDVESSNDRLRFERDQARQALAELQQRAVREKEALMRHLETIEADVREREVAYGQLRDGDLSVESALASQLKNVIEERAQLSEETFARSELERQLETARAEEAARTTVIQKLERDVSQMMKQLTVQQKTAGERDMEIHSCRGALTQLEAKNRELQVALQAAEEREASLDRQRNAAEVRLSASLDERRDTDAALVDFRANVGKLDGRLRYMKEELAGKTASIDQLRQEKSALDEAAATREVLIEQQRRRLTAVEDEVKRLRESMAVEVANEGVREELSATKDMLVRVSADLDRLVGENAGLRERVRALSDFNVSGSTRDDLGAKLSRKVTELKRRLSESEARHAEAVVSNERLASEMSLLVAASAAKLQSVDDDVNEVSTSTTEAAIDDVTSRERVLDDHLRMLQDKLVEKEEASLKVAETTRSAMVELTRLEAENELLKDQLLRQRSEKRWRQQSGGDSDQLDSAPSSLAFHRDDDDDGRASDEEMSLPYRRHSSCGGGSVHFGTQTEEWRTDDEKLRAVSYAGVADQQNLSAQMEVALRETDDRYRAQRRRHESNIKVLTRKLKEVLKSRKKLEEELSQANAKLAHVINEAAVAAEKNVASVPPVSATPRPSDDCGSRTRDAKVSYYRKRIVMMDNKLSETQRLYDVERKRADRNQELLIELEKQKGRLHVMAESNSSIKQHQSELEAVLLERESAISVLDLQAKNIHQRKQEEEAQLRENMKDLQAKLQLEQNSSRDLKKQMFKERFESGGLRKQIASLKSGLDEASRQMEAKMADYAKLERELDEQKSFTARLRGEVSSTNDKLLESRAQCESLQKEIEASHAKDPVLADQIKTLGWHMQKKNQEVAHLKDQCKQLDEQRQVELRQLNSKLDLTKQELADIKLQLQAALDHKFSYQTKLTELRTALKSSHDRNKILQAELSGHLSVLNSNGSSRGDRLDLKLPESPAPYDESLIASLLQQSLSLPKNGPLNNLHVCLNTLKQEMAILQQQLLDQTNGDS